MLRHNVFALILKVTCLPCISIKQISPKYQYIKVVICKIRTTEREIYQAAALYICADLKEEKLVYLLFRLHQTNR